MPISPAAILRDAHVSVLCGPRYFPPARLPGQWMGEGTDGEYLAEFAGRLRTMSEGDPAVRETREYLVGLRHQQRDDVLVHVHYSVLLEGVSRSAAAMLMEQGTDAVCTQLSPRHVDDESICFVMPPAIIGYDPLEQPWLAQVEGAYNAYTALVTELLSKYGWMADRMQRRQLAREAALGLLPSATATRLVVTANARDWRTVMLQCSSATRDLETRRVIIKVLRLLTAEAPSFFDDIEIFMAPDRHEAARVAVGAL